MKLNSSTKMTPITFYKFSGIHPFAPQSLTQGYDQLIEELETMLCEITGFDAVSFQPNTGPQCEYTGMLGSRQSQSGLRLRLSAGIRLRLGTTQ